MQDHYYSKKLGQYFPTRLEYLLYAHDGRGFGHVSRTVAVGLALKRLDPDARILLITGSSKTDMMIGRGPLDWIKLPSYRTVLVEGVPEGRDADSGYYKSVLGNQRAEMIKAIVEILRPYCVLVDHNPFGKRNELLKALKHSQRFDTQWVLGLRGIIGEDLNLWSPESSELLSRYYREIVWYGDSKGLGTEHLQRIRSHTTQRVTEMGYVSRLLEIGHLLPEEPSGQEKRFCTVSLPWLEGPGNRIIDLFRTAAEYLGPDQGTWHFFVPETHAAEIRNGFVDLPYCQVEQISERYVESLLNSRSAVIYGGYNSVLDVIAAGIPACVIIRSTRDGEQLDHLTRLGESVGPNLQIVQEAALSSQVLIETLPALSAARKSSSASINYRGAEATAKHLLGIVKQLHPR